MTLKNYKQRYKHWRPTTVPHWASSNIVIIKSKGNGIFIFEESRNWREEYFLSI